MKYFILFCLMVFAVEGRGQITLEHTYTEHGWTQLSTIDSGLWAYVYCNNQDSIIVYNLDHSLNRVVLIPGLPSTGWVPLSFMHGLYDTGYAYLLYNISNSVRVFNETGNLLFGCDSCEPLGRIALLMNCPANNFIDQTNHGAKLKIIRHGMTEVYSLPGRIPGCTTAQRSDVSGSIVSEAVLQSSAYPNPSSSTVRIAYELPVGVTHGELILSAEDGREVRRYRITNAFHDLLIDEAGIPSGTYFYKVLTTNAESAVKRIVVEK